jgi:hypothetical protein
VGRVLWKKKRKTKNRRARFGVLSVRTLSQTSAGLVFFLILLMGTAFVHVFECLATLVEKPQKKCPLREVSGSTRKCVGAF